MRKYLTGLAIAGSVFSLFATDARIETMGGTDNFFKDDWSIYRNAATIGSYDRMLIGSFGIYSEEGEDFTGTQYNRDAKKPYFGGTMSFKKSDSTASKFILGAVFNRYDPLLRFVLPEYSGTTVTNNDFLGYPVNEDAPAGDVIGVEYLTETVGKVDILVGYTLDNSMTVGMGAYLAFQSDKTDESTGAMTRVVKGNIGISGPMAENLELEASIGIAALTLIGRESDADNKSSKTVRTMTDDIAFSVDARVFADAPAINGAFVPHIQANVLQAPNDETIFDFNAGLGVNSYIDRGFIWGGIEGIFLQHPNKNVSGMTDNAVDTLAGTNVAYADVNQVGGKVAFGIERNMLADWLVWRVGAAKVLAYETFDDSNAGSHWIENSEDDHVSFGLGVNIEDRFKVDAVVAENMIYTFTNLFSGNSHHFSSRISATFNF
jgi:hypothetical protein